MWLTRNSYRHTAPKLLFALLLVCMLPYFQLWLPKHPYASLARALSLAHLPSWAPLKYIRTLISPNLILSWTLQNLTSTCFVRPAALHSFSTVNHGLVLQNKGLVPFAQTLDLSQAVANIAPHTSSHTKRRIHFPLMIESRSIAACSSSFESRTHE